MTEETATTNLMGKPIDYTLLAKAQRSSWHNYFMDIATVVSTKSTCLRRQIGSVAVDCHSKRILATGFNGAPASVEHCTSNTCYRMKNNIPSGSELQQSCRGVHSEENLICQAAISGIDLKGAVVFCTHQPCLHCTKLLINIGITGVFYEHPYPDTSGLVDALWKDYVRDYSHGFFDFISQKVSACIHLTREYMDAFVASNYNALENDEHIYRW